MFGGDSGDGRVIGHAGKDLPQAIFGDAKAEAPLKDFGGLFKEQNFEAITNAGDIGRGTVGGQGCLADDQCIERRQVGGAIDGLEARSQLFQLFACLTPGIEECDPAADLRGAGPGQNMNGERIGLGLTVAKANAGVQLVLARRQGMWQSELQEDACLFTGFDR
jgi:hypothetical protein